MVRVAYFMWAYDVIPNTAYSALTNTGMYMYVSWTMFCVGGSWHLHMTSPLINIRPDDLMTFLSGQGHYHKSMSHIANKYLLKANILYN